jgi:hypothetical protein
MQLESTLTCPSCGHRFVETMPTDACVFFYDCKGCGTRLKPSLATVAHSAPMARFGVRRSRPTTVVARPGPLRLETREPEPVARHDSGKPAGAFLVPRLVRGPAAAKTNPEGWQVARILRTGA